ncbi:MAG: hypothetical protein JWM33_3951 [Caulobacteraceae bacterium]|nr:hypothetical protein [Caulobacteraceae bacterium]
MTRSLPQQTFSTFPLPRSAPSPAHGLKGDKDCLKLVKPPKFEPRPMH